MVLLPVVQPPVALLPVAQLPVAQLPVALPRLVLLPVVLLPEAQLPARAGLPSSRPWPPPTARYPGVAVHHSAASSLVRSLSPSRPARRGWPAAAAAAAMALAVLSHASSAVAVGSPCFLPPVTAPIARTFQAPPCRWCAGNRGLDYATRPGTDVRSAAAGAVSFAGPVAGTSWVTVTHPGGVRTSYGPMSRVEVRRGASVGAGTLLGTSAGPLHFGVRVEEEYVDPAPLLAAPVHLVPRLVPLHGRIPPLPAPSCQAPGRSRGRLTG